MTFDPQKYRDTVDALREGRPPTCPERSPESRTPCALPDTRAAHYKGHESALGVGGNPILMVSWGTSGGDHARWDR